MSDDDDVEQGAMAAAWGEGADDESSEDGSSDGTSVDIVD